MTDKIKTSFVMVNGKKVPLQKIPTGMSGLTPETKKIVENSEKFKENCSEYKGTTTPVEEVQEYYETGEITTPEVTDYINSTSGFNEMEQMFDTIEE